jgi:pimeloyl-ACP methyl ester carboxylesterase
VSDRGALDARALLARAERRRVRLPEVEIALLDWGGGGAPILLHHANGFCKGVWGLVAERLAPRFRPIAMDARGHGDSTRPEAPGSYAWPRFAEDLAGVAERVAELCRVARLPLAVGHSFGGTSLLGAAKRRPELFERLVLVDPVVPRLADDLPPERGEAQGSLVERAGKRRHDWPSRAEARAFFAERELFERFDPRALDLYVLDGLRERADGSVELKCPGAVESAVFAGGGLVDVAALAEGNPIPALWLWASRGNFPRGHYVELAARMARARVEDLACGHLAPMERPDLVAGAILAFADEAGRGEIG